MNLAQYAAETGIKPIEFQKKLRDDHGLEPAVARRFSVK